MNKETIPDLQGTEMKLGSLLLRTAFALIFPIAAAVAQEVNPTDNPLIGTWILSEKGFGGCDQKRTFADHTQTWYINGKVVSAPATYAKSGETIYVQQHIGSGGTVAYVVVGPDEIKDTLGTNACHWKRQ